MQTASPISFGKFRLLEELARGSIATTHRAVLQGPSGFERQVAIKRMLPELAEQQHFVKTFIDQAKLLALLDHTNIVRTYDFGRVDDRYFMAMEHVEGQALADLAPRALSPAQAAYAGCQVCSALQHAHERGLVHGDLNPTNVLLGPDRLVKLVDFGVALLERAAIGDRPAQRVWGYLSPEQIEGSPATPRSDIFAVGVILWELLAGRKLFEAGMPHLTLSRVLRTTVGPISWGDDGPPSSEGERYEQICRTALARRSADRFRTAGEMADELIRALESTRDGLLVLYGGSRIAVREEDQAPRAAVEPGPAASRPAARTVRRKHPTGRGDAVRGEQSVAADEGSRFAPTMNPARAQAVARCIHGISARARDEARRIHRRSRTAFVLLGGMLAVSLAINAVFVVGALRSAGRPELASGGAAAAADPVSPALPARTPAPAPVATAPDARTLADAPQDVVATTAESHRPIGRRVHRGTSTRRASGPLRRRTAVDPTSPPVASPRPKDAPLSPVLPAWAIEQTLGQRLASAARACGVPSNRAVWLGVHVQKDGKVQRAFVAARRSGISQPLADCLRQRLLTIQIPMTLGRRTYLEWRLSGDRAVLVRQSLSR